VKARNNFLAQLLLHVCRSSYVDLLTMFVRQSSLDTKDDISDRSVNVGRSGWDVYSPSRVTECQMTNNDRKRIHALSRRSVLRASLYCDPWETGFEGMALLRDRKKKILLVKYESSSYSSGGKRMHSLKEKTEML